MYDFNELDIGVVAKKTNLSVSALRFYEEKGLIKSIGRDGLKRVFKKNVLEQISLITLAKYAGFSLQEIAAMFNPAGKPKINRTQLLQKADELNNTIKKFKAMHKGLLHVANCPKPNQLDCPNFQKLVRNVTKLQKLDSIKLKKKRKSKK